MSSKIQNPRAIAAKTIAKVLSGESLNDLIKAIPKSDQKAFVQECCYGVCRYYFRLEKVFKTLVKKPLKNEDADLQALLFVGFYQLIYLSTATHAAVSETVEAVKVLKKMWAVKFVNGVLREFLRQKENILMQVDKDEVAKFSHPKWFIDKVKHNYSDEWQKILLENNQHAPMMLRINCRKTTRNNYIELLKKADLECSPGLLDETIILSKPTDVLNLPEFSEGYVSVQDQSAQLAAYLLDVKDRQSVLDACAAPGGKTAHILEKNSSVELIALDVEESRCKKISETLKRLSLKAEVIYADALQPEKWWRQKLFDRILLDAPCSATGVIRRHPDIKLLRRESDINKVSELQYSLLKTLWPLLKVGGILLYVTCSVLPEENENVIEKFLQEHKDAKLEKLEHVLLREKNFGSQILPGDHGGDGFYYAKILKIS